MKPWELADKLEARLATLDIVKQRPDYFKTVLRNINESFAFELRIALKELEFRGKLELLREQYKKGLIIEREVLKELAKISEMRNQLLESKTAMLINDLMRESKYIEGITKLEEKVVDITRNLLINAKIRIAKLNNIYMDLEKVKNIYKYCSYSNLLHADKEIPSAISELDNHIAEFIKITEKVNA